MAEVPLPIVPPRLYRYRSLNRSENAVDQEIDSILNNYLYCSSFQGMNDPMEGFYRPSQLLAGKTDYKKIVREITSSKSSVGIACFTETYENVLMWAHYAGNYTGVCLSYSTRDLLAGLPHHVNLVRLAYAEEPPLISPSHTSNATTAAIRILSQKKYNWAYEREWRVLGPVGQVRTGSLQPVKQIFFGSRVDLSHRHRILSKIQGTAVKAYMMNVGGYDHNWEPINAAARRRKTE
ncbi:DUF2971 domain-containing protein [Lichenicoccus sp.]|uniref:DUF2971 domain-containing protein n=1 Tax=Lichenicoccus sp. TaxID=2781899 RepID=UPI003D145D06